MKIGIFTDSHYSSAKTSCFDTRLNCQSLRKIKEAFAYFEDQKCDLIVCLGDLIDKEECHQKETENLKEVAKIFKNSSIPSVCVMGNHDGFQFSRNEFYEILGGGDQEMIKKDGKTLLFLDACYFKNGKHYTYGDRDWTDTFYPFADKLKSELRDDENEVFIFIHQNIDPEISENHRLFNDEEIRDIIENFKNVKIVFQGHYHCGNNSQQNAVKYITLPAMCEGENRYYIFDI